MLKALMILILIVLAFIWVNILITAQEDYPYQYMKSEMKGGE